MNFDGIYIAHASEEMEMILRQLKNTEWHSQCCMCDTGAMAALEYIVKHPIMYTPDELKIDLVCLQHAKEQLDLWLENLQ